jgi:predicted metalloprotease
MRLTPTIQGSVVALAWAVSGSKLSAAPSPTDPVSGVTPSEVDASNAKVWAAYDALVAMWSADFKQIGEKFSAPGMARYRMQIRTPCGHLNPENAEYCAANNTIYFDDVFVAGQAKAAAEALGTDGDMAGVDIIAHEMGHAVAQQLGYKYRKLYANEATADCLAGAFAQHAATDGSLEQGDIQEAEFGMANGGDPLSGRIMHGTSEQRVENFRNGVKGGAGACLADFRGMRG